MKADNITEILSVISTWAIAISAIVAALSAVCKPLRDGIGRLFKRISGVKEKQDKIIEEIQSLKRDIASKIDEINGRCEVLSAKIDQVSDENKDNERARLKDEIFRMGNYCRKGTKISSEEFRNLQVNFQKYTSLGGNDMAHSEYNMIEKYYNTRGWLNGGVTNDME